MNSRQSVIIAMFLSLGIYVLANIPKAGVDTKDPKAVATATNIGGRAVFAWMGLFLFFTILTDIPSTQPLAAGFVWLLFLSILFKYGPQAFTNINVGFGGSAIDQTRRPKIGGV